MSVHLERNISAPRAMLEELRDRAVAHPVSVRAAAWDYLAGLGARNDRDALAEMFAAGAAPQGPDGKMEGLIVGKLFGIPEAHLANPLMRIEPTWRGKTFDLERGIGWNRLAPLARFVMPIITAGYLGLRRAGSEMEGFDFAHALAASWIEPDKTVRALDYGVPEYRNPSIRTFPIARTRDEVVEVVPGVYLGRALLRMYNGEIRLIAYFALREPIGSHL
ncbi:hypothetical protein [Hoyosella subflava]|uniref:Uncharacterized protein n=1 Tax=Hoyosella subflava (strain DSM 45089 / JCM 17490 / NBRC 109087 / DQS3-9A1) TaxID=443218 RepID=F6ENQ2_HOYSD|nr:hypothetical protein [Hoyosella subflava]AEF42909.1 hypothetical protein AS9A_4477 [Hoyosella subflava DQS3-9A1]